MIQHYKINLTLEKIYFFFVDYMKFLSFKIIENLFPIYFFYMYTFFNRVT